MYVGVIRSTEKNQKNQYGQAPAMYSEQKAFCTGCGKELSACEEFCSVCGKQRTTPAQGAQPTFQQPVYPQMGYVQDAPSGVFFVISCVFGTYEVIYVLLALRTSFKLALYGLAWTGFIAVFAIQVFALYRKNAPQRQTFVQRVNSGINSINPQMSYYSPEQPQTTALQQEQPSAIPEEAQTPSFAKETIYCTQCGAAMDSHSMFCTKCGARLKNDPV